MESTNGTGGVDGDQEVTVDRERGWCPWRWWHPPDALAPVVGEVLAWMRARHRGGPPP